MARFTNPPAGGGGNGGDTFDIVYATHNSDGTNVKIGDDAWLGDIDHANTVNIKGVENESEGYVSMGSNGQVYVGNDGNNNLILNSTSNNIQMYMDGAAYIGDAVSENRIAQIKDLTSGSMTLITSGDIVSGTELFLENIPSDYKDLVLIVDNAVVTADTPLTLAVGDPTTTGSGGYHSSKFFGHMVHVNNQNSTSGAVTTGAYGDGNNFTAGFGITLGNSVGSFNLTSTASVYFKVYDYSRPIGLNEIVRFESAATYLSSTGYHTIDKIDGYFSINNAEHGNTPVSKLSLKTNGTATFRSGTVNLYGQDVYSGGTYRLYGVK